MNTHEQAIKDALIILGAHREEKWNGGHFTADGHCEGCRFEVEEVVHVLRKAIDLPVRRVICPNCDKWTIPHTMGDEKPPTGKDWRCIECNEWGADDEFIRVHERAGSREGNGL